MSAFGGKADTVRTSTDRLPPIATGVVSQCTGDFVVGLAEDLDRAVDRGLQEMIRLGLLVLRRNDSMSRRNGCHEIAFMPMTEHWQGRKHPGIGFGIDRYIEIGLVVIFVAGGKSGADISGFVGVSRRKRD